MTKDKEEQKILETSPNPEFVRGEVVEVSDDERFINRRPWKYVCTIDHEYKYLAEVNWPIPMWWKHIRKLPQQEAWPKRFTEKDIEDFICEKFPEARHVQMSIWIADFLNKHGMLEK